MRNPHHGQIQQGLVIPNPFDYSTDVMGSQSDKITFAGPHIASYECLKNPLFIRTCLGLEIVALEISAYICVLLTVSAGVVNVAKSPPLCVQVFRTCSKRGCQS